jgi:hypothetical protein
MRSNGAWTYPSVTSSLSIRCVQHKGDPKGRVKQACAAATPGRQAPSSKPAATIRILFTRVSLILLVRMPSMTAGLMV